MDFISILGTRCVDHNLETHYPLYICILMKLDKVYYLSPIVILLNVIHYHILKGDWKFLYFDWLDVLVFHIPFRGRRLNKKQKRDQVKHTWQAHRQEWSDSNMLLSMLTHKFIRAMNIGFYLSACHVWLWGTLYQCYFGLIADSSIIHYACEEWSPRDIFFFSVWLHEYTKRLGFLCARNQTINVSLPCLDYMQAISICSVLDSYQCLLFEFSYKKMCDSVNRVVPSHRHSNLANCSVRIISLLMRWWINVTSAKKIKIQLN